MYFQNNYFPSFFWVATLLLQKSFNYYKKWNKDFQTKRFHKKLVQSQREQNSGIFRLNKIISKLLTISKCLQLNCYQIQQLLAIVKNSMVNKKHCFEHAERFHISHITCSIILLGDSWNYMPPIVVPSSAKHIATQVLVNGRKDFFWEASFVMSSVPTRNYLFKVNNWNRRKE